VSTADYCKAEKCGMIGYVAVTAINTGADTDGRRYLGTCAGLGWTWWWCRCLGGFATRRQVVAPHLMYSCCWKKAGKHLLMMIFSHLHSTNSHDTKRTGESSARALLRDITHHRTQPSSASLLPNRGASQQATSAKQECSKRLPFPQAPSRVGKHP
jgi:hypothetical protein